MIRFHWSRRPSGRRAWKRRIGPSTSRSMRSSSGRRCTTPDSSRTAVMSRTSANANSRSSRGLSCGPAVEEVDVGRARHVARCRTRSSRQSWSRLTIIGWRSWLSLLDPVAAVAVGSEREVEDIGDRRPAARARRWPRPPAAGCRSPSTSLRTDRTCSRAAIDVRRPSPGSTRRSRRRCRGSASTVSSSGRNARAPASSSLVVDVGAEEVDAGVVVVVLRRGVAEVTRLPGGHDLEVADAVVPAGHHLDDGAPHLRATSPAKRSTERVFSGCGQWTSAST